MKISVSLLFFICVASQAQYNEKPFRPNNSTLKYSYKNSKCNLSLENLTKIRFDSFMSHFINCDHVDYLLSVKADQTIVFKIKLEVEKILKIKEDIILFEIFYDPKLTSPFCIISRKDFNDPGDIIKILKFRSTKNKMVLRVHKTIQNLWIPFSAYFRPQGICPSDQQKCLGEDDCYELQSRCDGVWDCMESGFDEINCAGCSNSYRCQNKSSSETLCFRSSDRCNGRPMCMNGDDQRNCNAKQCNEMNDAFLCKNKKCIRSNWICDGIDDCLDYSDEVFCPNREGGNWTVIATTGSVSCLVLSLIIIWFSCKLYLLKKRRSRERLAMLRGDDALIGVVQQEERDWWEFFFRDCRPAGQSGLLCHHGQHISPITGVQNEIFSRLSAPPPYQIAMATSRSFDEVMAEEMARRISGESGERSDEELLDHDDSIHPPRDTSESDDDDDSILVLRDPPHSQSCDSSSANERQRNVKVKKIVQRAAEACNRIYYEDEPPTFEEAMGEVSDPRGRESNPAEINSSASSDNDSDRVPPSYSSLFPSVENMTQTQIFENEMNNRSPTSRFSFLKTLATLKSMISRWSSRSNTSSLTELIDGQEEFSGRGYDHSEHDVQRVMMARSSAQNHINEELRIQRWLNQSTDVQHPEEVANLMQWDSEHSSDRLSGRHGDSVRFSSNNHQLQQGALSELGQVRNWAFSMDGIYEGDYNVEITTDSENDGKDDI